MNSLPLAVNMYELLPNDRNPPALPLYSTRRFCTMMRSWSSNVLIDDQAPRDRPAMKFASISVSQYGCANRQMSSFVST